MLGRGGYAARVYVSDRLADTARDPSGWVIPTGVDFGLFVPSERAAARAALGIAPQERVVLFGGAPGNAVKCYDIYREALDAFRARSGAVRELVLAEHGQARTAVVAKFAAADALLFTSRRGAEGSPMVVKEAAVMGLPVVAVDVGDVAKVLADVDPSVVVPFPEPWGGADSRAALVQRLAAGLMEVLDKPVRSNGREQAGWLDSRLIAERIVEVYRRAITGTGANAGAGAPSVREA
jgi:glycosyltransferase involved in cell wall biosynthesis